jgi:NADH dehydrogenase
MRILITGCTGFIGRDLIKELNKEGYKITCFIRSRENFSGEGKIEYIYGDLKNMSEIKNAAKNIDIIIHLANSEENPEENILFVKNIIDAAKKEKVKKIIFFSSMAAKRKVIDRYGKSKAECEKKIIDSGINYVIIRPTMVYSHKKIPFFIKPLKMLPLIIPIIGDGKYKINPVYKGDLIDIVKKTVSVKDKKIYEAGGGEPMEFNEIINRVKKEKRIKKINIHIPVKIALILNGMMKFTSSEAIKGIKEDSNPDIEKIKKELKITPRKFCEDIKNVSL